MNMFLEESFIHIRINLKGGVKVLVLYKNIQINIDCSFIQKIMEHYIQN